MQVVDKDGNVYGQGLQITSIDGKPKVPVINTDITIGTTAIVGGVAGRLLFDDAGIVGETNGVHWDKVNSRLGLGTTTPTQTLDIQGNISIGLSAATTVRAYYNSTTRNQLIYTNNSSLEFFQSITERMRLAPGSGNLLLNTATDAGYKLDVNGTSIYRESLTNTTGGFLHKSTSTSNDAFWSIVSGSVYFIVSAGGYCKTTSNLVTAATGVGTINASAISQIDSVTKGFLPPRMSNTQMLAIATPAEGLMVYDTTNRKLCCYDGVTWQPLF